MLGYFEKFTSNCFPNNMHPTFESEKVLVIGYTLEQKKY
jgi:hypothetical protein